MAGKGRFARGARPSYNPNFMTPTEVRADFPADPASAAKARRFVDATLRTWSCDTLVDVARLLVTELVANAVLHAGTGVAVVIRRVGDRLRIEVHDGSARLPVPKHYSSLSGTGRGLLLVERMSHVWGAARAGTGKVVWFELDSATAASADRFGAFDVGEPDLDDLDELDREVGSGRGGADAGGVSGVGPRALVLAGRW